MAQNPIYLKSPFPMQINIVTKPAFAVIGIEGSGPSDQGPLWIGPLWGQAFSRLSEIQHLITGSGWGLMSDTHQYLARWTDRGRYLAGWEVAPGYAARPWVEHLAGARIDLCRHPLHIRRLCRSHALRQRSLPEGGRIRTGRRHPRILPARVQKPRNRLVLFVFHGKEEE